MRRWKHSWRSKHEYWIDCAVPQLLSDACESVYCLWSWWLMHMDIWGSFLFLNLWNQLCYEVWWVVYLWQMLSCNLQGRYRVCWGSPWDECVYLEPKPSAQIYTPPSAGKGLQWERMRSCWVQGGKGGLGACFVTPVAVQKFWPALCWEEIGWELNGSPECFDLLFFWGFKCSF